MVVSPPADEMHACAERPTQSRTAWPDRVGEALWASATHLSVASGEKNGFCLRGGALHQCRAQNTCDKLCDQAGSL